MGIHKDDSEMCSDHFLTAGENFNTANATW